jgi:protease PrsW
VDVTALNGTTIGYAFLGGLLPSFIWLYFLLKEDARCPEPKHVVALAFVAGMSAVPLALPFEQFAKSALVGGTPMFVAWALVEEVLKYAAAGVFILWRRQVDEAPDYVMYMVTVALGFAAAENMLFLVDPLSTGQFVAGAITGNLRFLGSTLLHVIASALIGLTFAFSAKLNPPSRTAAAALGLILAITLHTAFNTLIIREGTSSALSAFFLVWTGAVIVLAAFEVLKYFQYSNLPNNTCQPL